METNDNGELGLNIAEDKGQVRAKFNFEGKDDRELCLQRGDVLTLLDDSDPNWWKGSKNGKDGVFPSAFVERLANPKVSVKFNFVGSGAGELSLKRGDVLTLLEDKDENWWRGRKNGKEGVFPANFVERII